MLILHLDGEILGHWGAIWAQALEKGESDMYNSNLMHHYHRVPEQINWVISPLPLYTAEWSKQLSMTSGGPMCILGFHKSSMELKHTYGPFPTPDEMIRFAREHHITLPGMS